MRQEHEDSMAAQQSGAAFIFEGIHMWKQNKGHIITVTISYEGIAGVPGCGVEGPSGVFVGS